MKFKVGQIVFFNWEDSTYGDFIRFFNRIKYGERGWAHCGIITKVNKQSVQIHEALSNGFVKSNYPKWFIEEGIHNREVEVKETKKRLTLVNKHAEKYLGTPYGWIDIGVLVLSLFLGRWTIGLTGAKRLICSEAVARVLYDSSNKRINFEKEYNKSYDLIIPQEIYQSEEVRKINGRG